MAQYLIGRRIRELRGRLLTQRELADRAGVSVDLIRKLEQGSRQTASITSLQKIARALDVSVSSLVGKVSAQVSNAPAAGVMAIRRALLRVDDLIASPADGDIEPLSLVEAERTVDYLWGAYWSGRYELLGSLLPTALFQMRATRWAASGSEQVRAAEALAKTYQAAGDTLVHLGHSDAAFFAVREALRTAREGQDELLPAALLVSVAWQLLVQGRYAESEQVALTAAAEIDPDKDVSQAALSAYGVLTVTAATAAARARKVGAVTDLLRTSREVASRLGSDQAFHQTTFGPAKVAMLTVDCHVAGENYVEALVAAQALPPDAPLPLATRARHLADVAYSHVMLGHDSDALTTLFTMENMAPDWIKYQTLPRQVARALLARERRRSTPLRELAQRLGVTHPAD